MRNKTLTALSAVALLLATTAAIQAQTPKTTGFKPVQVKATVVARPDTSQPNKFYNGNKAPLLPSPLINLPFGTIKPQGWLRKQLELEADGFTGHLTEISNFLKKDGNAWLSPEGKGHSGWEEMPYWLRGFSALGFVLDDKRVIDETKIWLEAAIKTRQPDGYFGTADNKKNYDMMPNMSMMFALRSYYEYTGDKRVIDLLTNYFHWQLSIPDNKFFAGGWQVPRNGDNMDSVYWLYNRTGDPKLLELGDKLMRTGSRWMGKVTGGHNVDYSQGFRKPAQYYQQTKDPKYLQATENNFNDMYDVYGQVPGGMFGGDEFARPGHTDPQQAIETCGTVDMMLSQEILLIITGDLKWADRCEDATFNTLPASFTSDLKALRYLTSPNQSNSDRRTKSPVLADGGPMQQMNPFDHRCCQHNSGMGWPYFAQNTWHATPGNGLAAVMYAPSKVTARVGDGTSVTVTENTKYPFDGVISFAIQPVKAVNFPFYLRVPVWASKVAITVNGKPVPVQAKPQSYIRLDRKWAPGDVVTVKFPMDVRLRTWAKNKNAVSVDRGPLTYSVKIDEKYVKRTDIGTEKWPVWEIFSASPWNYGLVIDQGNPAKSFEVVQKPWPASGQPFRWDNAPIELKVKARKIPNWQENYWGLIDALQPSPVKSDSPVETISMIPMGAGRLRVSALPVIGSGPEAHEWVAPGEPVASFIASFGSYDSLFDGKVPQKSNDTRMGRFSWWAWENFGTTQWVKKVFDAPQKVSSVEVFWNDENLESERGDITLPASWRVMYKVGDEWKEVPNPSPYVIADNQMCKVTFDPVTTKELRLEVTGKRGKVAGLYEWVIK